MVSCEAGVEDVRNRKEEAQKDPAEEEAARRRAYEKAVTRAVQEEKARRNAYSQEAQAHEEALRRAAEEEAARRQIDAATLIKTLPTIKKEQQVSLRDGCGKSDAEYNLLQYRKIEEKT